MAQHIYGWLNNGVPVRSMICMGYAHLKPEQVEKMKAIEKELKVTLLAYEKPTYSALSDADLKRIQDLEKDLGLSLVAYEVQ
jgi:uncharacterized protein YbaP (TraB family)